MTHLGPAPAAAAGQPRVKKILPRDEPTIWHEAAALLPKLPDAAGQEAEPALVQAKKAAVEQLLQREEQVGAGWGRSVLL